MIEIEINSTPKSQQRHRHTKKGFVYDPSKIDKQDLLSQMLSKAPKTPYTKAISLYIRFCMPYVKKHYRTGKFSKELKQNPPISHIYKPDIDNLLKLVMDAGNKVFWKDDSQISRVQMEKIYDNSGSTIITIVEEDD